jgi:ketosteroid isomerase-like protein
MKEFETLIERRSEAIRAKDLDGLMSFYTPDIVYFDIVPPLRYIGTEALRGRFRNWFDGFQGGIRQDPSDFQIVADEDVTSTAMLITSGGTLPNGAEVERTVRATSVWRRTEDGWLIFHEHVSVPVDLTTGRVADS